MIDWIHRHIAPLAAVLLALVTVQLLDMPLCADEAREAQHGHTAADLADASLPIPSAHPVPDHGPDDLGDSVMPDCLCHVVFVSTAHMPELSAVFISSPFSASRYVEPPSTPPLPVDHVPLA